MHARPPLSPVRPHLRRVFAGDGGGVGWSLKRNVGQGRGRRRADGNGRVLHLRSRALRGGGV